MRVQVCRGIGITFTKGARQLVVQEALETILSLGSYLCSFTPTTYVGMSEPLAGAVITTFEAPASICLPAPSLHDKDMLQIHHKLVDYPDALAHSAMPDNDHAGRLPAGFPVDS